MRAGLSLCRRSARGSGYPVSVVRSAPNSRHRVPGPTRRPPAMALLRPHDAAGADAAGAGVWGAEWREFGALRTTATPPLILRLLRIQRTTVAHERHRLLRGQSAESVRAARAASSPARTEPSSVEGKGLAATSPARYRPSTGRRVGGRRKPTLGNRVARRSMTAL